MLCPCRELQVVTSHSHSPAFDNHGETQFTSLVFSAVEIVSIPVVFVFRVADVTFLLQANYVGSSRLNFSPFPMDAAAALGHILALIFPPFINDLTYA